MNATRLAPIALVVLLIVSVSSLAWATKTTLAAEDEAGEVAVDTGRSHFEAGEEILIRLRNVAEETMVGSPRILVLNANGVVQQSFAFGQFILELEPGESVWVEWQTTPHTPNPCMYGKSDESGAAEMSYPCPMPMDQPQTGEAGAPVDDGMARCYPCPPYYPGLRGEFVIVGIFGSHADAEVITIE